MQEAHAGADSRARTGSDLMEARASSGKEEVGEHCSGWGALAACSGGWSKWKN